MTLHTYYTSTGGKMQVHVKRTVTTSTPPAPSEQIPAELMRGFECVKQTEQDCPPELLAARRAQFQQQIQDYSDKSDGLWKKEEEHAAA